LAFHPQAVERMAERFYRHLVMPEKTADIRRVTAQPADGALFVDVSLTDNRFAVSASANVVIGGADLQTATTLLRLGAGNELPSGTVDTEGDCAALTQQDNCNGGAALGQRDLGYMTNLLGVQCLSLPPRMAGGVP
jgi:hypothetical protein